MNKYFKEGLITVLLAIVIILLLIIALYGYVPSREDLSDLQKYKKTEQTTNVLTEIKTAEVTGEGQESIITSYSVSQADLNVYSKSGSYKGGYSNPFQNIVANPYGYISSDSRPASDQQPTSTTTTNAVSGASTNSTGYFKKTGTNK